VSRQNRVTPWGELIATSARGTLLGNRGCLHDEHQQIRRTYQLQRWIICQLEFKGRRHIIMTPGHYTELFFLDEATALAAGHRPCVECSRDRFNEFRAVWAQANTDLVGSARPLATTIDAILHRERIHADGRKITYPDRLAALPDGAFIQRANAETAWLMLGDRLLAWSPFGYTQRVSRPVEDIMVDVLTPRSIVRALATGYQARLHPSANQDAA
jgi:hypothetical protein